MDDEALKRAPLRMVLCTCGGLFGALVLRSLRRASDVDIVAIVRSNRILTPRHGFLGGALEQIRLSSIGYALYLWCVTSAADALCALGGLKAVPARSRARGPRVLVTRNVNDSEGVAFLRAQAPDVLVSAFFNQRIGAPALAIPRLGAVNIHPSLLPADRGVDPVFQAQRRGAARVGVSVHRMSVGLDEGALFAQRSLAMNPASSVLATTARLYGTGARLLVTLIPALRTGEPGTPQQGVADYRSWPTREELRDFKRRGGRLARASDLVAILRGRMPGPRLKVNPVMGRTEALRP
jgi:methionyl-tRNA formyltransferase